MQGTILTGVDKLVSLIEEKNRISIQDAAKQLAVPKVVVQEWANFLQEKGIVHVEYKLTTPYLVKQGISKKETAKRSKVVMSAQEGFVRKVESMLQFIEKETAGLKNVRMEFRVLSEEVEGDVRNIRDELETLQNYEEMKRGVDREILQQQTQFHKDMKNIEDDILKKKSEYDVLVKSITRNKVEIDKEIQTMELSKQTHKNLQNRLVKFEDVIKNLNKGYDAEDKYLNKKMHDLADLKRHVMKMKQTIKDREKKIHPLIHKRKAHQQKIFQLQKKIIAKFSKKSSRVEASERLGSNAKRKFEKFFSEKVKVDILMDKIDIDIEKLKVDLLSIKQEAKAIDLVTKSKQTSQITKDLQARFIDVERKRKKFEQEIITLGKLIKSK